MKGRVKRVSLTFTPAEYQALEKAAKEAGEKPAPFIKDLALQAHNAEVVLPEAVENELAEATRLIRTVANNVNQMARHSHQIGRVLDEHEPLLEIAKLDGLLRQTLQKIARFGSGNLATDNSERGG